ncbi:hypothetical protein U9M48_004171 [Paspalum notatum var. saurae]|uniref:LIM zinc-binding domain-containing protein n=1 Tax=Paspalum notatum var. saurae TaxID=547442 RepID=A0AAQ3SEM4_PASNO
MPLDQVGPRVCGACKLDIGHGHGHYFSCMGIYWHPQCFRCSSCKHSIRETEFTLLGTEPYHKLWYKELHHSKCDVCLQFVRSGLTEYRAHPFWGQKYCPLHEQDRTSRCCSSKEHKVCHWETATACAWNAWDLLSWTPVNASPCTILSDYYEGMNMKLDQQIPMLLGERLMKPWMERAKVHTTCVKQGAYVCRRSRL